MKTTKTNLGHKACFVLACLTFLNSSSLSNAQQTMLVKDIAPGSPSSIQRELTDVNGILFFVADDGNTGLELWKSNGTPGGTVLVRDINPGPLGSIALNSPNTLTSFNGELYFTANDGSGIGGELWKSDGTASGTFLLKEIVPGLNGSSPKNFKVSNGILFFAADDPNSLVGVVGLYKSDGTAAGTVLLKEFDDGFGQSFPFLLTDVNGTLFFVASDGVTGEEIWKSNGTTIGTILVKDITPPAVMGRPTGLINVNGTLFFVTTDGITGNELWKSDGTETGTLLVKDINSGPASAGPPNTLAAVDGILYFYADNGATGIELWKSDGTANGTVLVKDINAGLGHSFPRNGIGLNSILFFTANDNINGTELWRSDGSSGGTFLIKDIDPGFPSSLPRELTALGDTVYFAASDNTQGRELWQSDGTFNGTQLVDDIFSGASNSTPQRLVISNNTLFFDATNGLLGFELWALQPPIRVTLTPNNPPIQIPPGGGQFDFDVTLDNVSDQSIQTQVWNQIIRPNGEPVGPTIGPATPTIPSQQSLSRSFTQEVPAGAPAGQYAYIFNVGTFPNIVDDFDSFQFTKLGATSAWLKTSSEETVNWVVLDPETKLQMDGRDWENLRTEDVIEILLKGFVLEQNYPNPFNPETTIQFDLPAQVEVNISIFNLLGERVRLFMPRLMHAGTHRLQWNAKDDAGHAVPSGVYILRFKAGYFNASRKLILLR